MICSFVKYVYINTGLQGSSRWNSHEADTDNERKAACESTQTASDYWELECTWGQWFTTESDCSIYNKG